MSRDGMAEHNVIATFPKLAAAKRAVSALEASGIADEVISFLAPADVGLVRKVEARELPERQLPARVARDAAVGGAGGGAAGGAAGLLAGSAALAIEGVGPAIAAGIWATALAGAAAGATAGGVIGGIRKMWQERYRDAIQERKLLVGVHSESQEEADRAQEILREGGPLVIDRFGPDGELLESEQVRDVPPEEER